MAGGRRKLSEEEARILVHEWRASGKALTAWCAARGIDGRSMRFWAGRLEGMTELRVVELNAPARQVTRASRIRLRLDGVDIVVGDDFSELALSRVLRAVRAC